MINYREAEKMIKELEEENRALMMRCLALTRGTMCIFCKMRSKCDARKNVGKTDDEH